jgi:hypothetical protein
MPYTTAEVKKGQFVNIDNSGLVVSGRHTLTKKKAHKQLVAIYLTKKDKGQSGKDVFHTKNKKNLL